MNTPDQSYGMDESSAGAPQHPPQDSNSQIDQYLQHYRVEMSDLRQEVEGLRGQNTWLKVFTGLLAILIGGSYAWFFIQLDSVERVDPAVSETESFQDYQQRLQQLEDELVTLNESIPTNLEERLEQTEAQIQQVQSEVNTLRNRPAPSVTDPSDSPASEPARRSPSTQNGDDASTLPDSGSASPDKNVPTDSDSEGLN